MTGRNTEASGHRGWCFDRREALAQHRFARQDPGLSRRQPSERRMPNSVHRRFGALVMACVFAISAVAAQEDAPALKRGADLLATNCARCHATGTTGSSPHPDAPAFRTLSQKYPIEGLAEALAEGLSVGHPDMPEFTFESDDVGAILSYLKSIQER